MQIQSLSICVPAKCPNHCKFCVAHMHEEKYKDQLNCNMPFYDLYLEDFEQRLLYSRDNGCNTMMITSSGETLANRNYLALLGIINKKMEKPYRNIELQTSGVFLDEGYLRFLRNHVWVKTISLSLSDMFNSESNAEIMQIPEKLQFKIPNLCKLIKKYDFNLRLSLNISNVYDKYRIDEILTYAKDTLGANQLTIRKLYESNNNTLEDKWIREHTVNNQFFSKFTDFVKINGFPLRKLEFGSIVYDCSGLSIVIDEDCMAKNVNAESLKYLILREDCHLYSHWDSEGSLVF